MIIQCTLKQHLQRLGQYFTILSLTSPRQVGKTTILKVLFPEYKYVSLENPDIRAQAIEYLSMNYIPFEQTIQENSQQLEQAAKEDFSVQYLPLR